MDMGLDEIIKRKKRTRNFQPKKAGLQRSGGLGSRNKTDFTASRRRNLNTGGGQIVDARLKIIQKTRSKLKDARERLQQIARKSDAREKILRRKSYNDLLASSRNGKVIPLRGYQERATLPRRTISNKEAVGVHTYGRDQMLYRTVNNRGNVVMADDIANSWNQDAVPRLQIHVPNLHMDTVIHRSQMLRTNSVHDDSWLRTAPNKQNAYRRSDDVKSRLEPVRHQDGYRIVVSNLQPTVTHEDIKELFEDIGTLIGSRLVRPGTAEVIYKTMEDAVNAVETYHNRQLDGQPMKCMLVKPSNVCAKGLAGTKGSIVPDVHAIHKALFKKCPSQLSNRFLNLPHISASFSKF